MGVDLNITFWHESCKQVYRMIITLITLVNSINILCLYYFWVADFELGIHFFLSPHNLAMFPDWQFLGRLLAFRIYFQNFKFLKLFYLKRKNWVFSYFQKKVDRNWTNDFGDSVLQIHKIIIILPLFSIFKKFSL